MLKLLARTIYIGVYLYIFKYSTVYKVKIAFWIIQKQGVLAIILTTVQKRFVVLREMLRVSSST